MSKSITSLTKRTRSCIRPRPTMFALLLGELLSACGGGGASGPAAGGDPAVRAAPAPPPQTYGHYVGAVKIAGATYFGDAVFTQDGEVRLYLGGLYDNGGELQLVRPV